MSGTVTRRDFLAIGSLAAFGLPALSQPKGLFQSLPRLLAQLEKSCSGRLGVAVLDTGTGKMAGHRTDERFAMCSTFKMLLAAAVLQRADLGRDHLDRTVDIPPKPLLFNSPLTEEHAGGRMTVGELC